MKKIVSACVVPLFLASCGGAAVLPDETQTWSLQNEQTGHQNNGKKEFLIQTKTLSELNQAQSIVKSWKITSSSEVIISSQASGRVQSIRVTEWQNVKKWQTLVVLQDNLSNYGIQVERSKNALERSKINYDSTLLTLDKAISDTKIAYDKAKLSDDTLKKDTELRLQQAKYDLQQSSLWIDSSKSSLDLSKLEWDLAKSKWDYEISLQNDDVTLENFKASIRSTYNSLNLVYFDLLNVADELFWVSEKNKRLNDEYEIYLWAKNNTEKLQAETQIRALLADYEIFKNLDYQNIDKHDYSYHLSQIENRFQMLINVVDISKNVLKNSVESTTFPQWAIDALFQWFSGYGQNVQSIHSGFISLKNSINSFVSTYKQNQESRLKSIELLEKQVEIARLNLQSWEITTQSSYDRLVLDSKNQLENSKIGLETAKNNYDNALQNKNITLRSLQNAIRDSEVSYSEASKNYSKLTITAPIDGVIAEKTVDIWQEISPGTKVFSMVSKTSLQVELFLTSEEIKYLSVDDEVQWIYQWKKIPWKIMSISSVSTKDFTFKVTLALLENVQIIWDFIEIHIPIEIEYMLVPVNAVKILPNNKGIVYRYIDGTIAEQEVTVGKIFGENIEILDVLEEDFEMILTDITQFSQDEYELKPLK